jgi:hypothetical protein
MAALNPAELDIENDCILVQTDCTFNIALIVIKSLKIDGVLHERSYKDVTIVNIESNDQDDRYSLRFGGGGNLPFSRRLQYFARTASSVLRMMMLESVNASQWCPQIGYHSEHRNRQKMQPDVGLWPFAIAASKEAAEEYYTHYDQLHPHFKIEKGVWSAQPADWYMQSMMLIFRRDFTEVIEIGTTFQAGYRPYAQFGFGTFQSNAHVRCIVRDVTNPDHDGLRFLRALTNISGYQHECFTLARLLDRIAQRLPIQAPAM